MGGKELFLTFFTCSLTEPTDVEASDVGAMELQTIIVFAPFAGLYSGGQEVAKKDQGRKFSKRFQHFGILCMYLQNDLDLLSAFSSLSC